MAKRLPMTGWFDPGLLVQTGIRAAVSTAFGQFADKREAIAAANAIQPTPADGEFDYSARHGGGDFWFDFLADSGDGWNPTYAMARLVAEDTLKPAGSDEPLSRGRILILGGDQVYPTASREEYRHRFIGPFEEAYAPGGARRWPDKDGERPDLYAIPGNHDWYDGLNSFFGLFCRRRVARDEIDLGISRQGKVIGGRRTRQTRSYFAIQLPGGWWVWGTDSQLEGYIDQPQIDYFQHAAAHWMAPNSKLILCVADPAWAYVDPRDPDKKFESFSYLERLAGLARKPLSKDKQETSMGHELKLVLTGDSHHYCRYEEDDRSYIVCGGGGAFLHPTHHLKDKSFKYRFPKPGEDARGSQTGSGSGGPPPADANEHRFPRHFHIARDADGSEALFPDRKASWWLGTKNLLFPILNPTFVGVLLIAYALFAWILDFNARIAGYGTLADGLRQVTIRDAMGIYVSLLVTSPWPLILMLIALGGYYYFADSPTSTARRILMGFLHSAAQTLLVTLTLVLAIRATEGLIPWPKWDSLGSTVLAVTASAIVSGLVFGAYLLVSLNLFGRHPNEGFSSLRIEGFKSFLRLRIDGDGRLTIYPVGLEKVPKDDGRTLKNPTLHPHLIENPIVIP